MQIFPDNIRVIPSAIYVVINGQNHSLWMPPMIIIMDHGKDKNTDDADGDIRTSENWLN